MKRVAIGRARRAGAAARRGRGGRPRARDAGARRARDARRARGREIVGARSRAHAQVRSVRDGVCTIEVDGPGWATQLRYAERQLVARANERCGPGVVTSIRVVVQARSRS